MSAVRSLETQSDYDDVMNNNSRVMIKFYATWCGPCKILANFYKSKVSTCTNVVCCEADAEVLEDVADSDNINKLPVVIYYVNKREVARFEGCEQQEFNNFFDSCCK